MDDHADVDLALIQIDEQGVYPAVRGIARSVDTPVGAAIATIGFPLGTDTPMDGTGNNFAAKTSLTIGTVSKSVSDVLQIDAFASHGSSGSPVVDNHGHVIGVVWGGPPGAAGRIVYAVPAEKIAALLDTREVDDGGRYAGVSFPRMRGPRAPVARGTLPGCRCVCRYANSAKATASFASPSK